MKMLSPLENKRSENVLQNRSSEYFTGANGYDVLPGSKWLGYVLRENRLDKSEV